MKLAIFLPGLQLERKEPDLEKYAIRLKKALEINDRTTAHHYTLKMSKEKFGLNDEEEVDIATIKLNTPTKTIDHYKIYKFNYANLLTGELEKRSSLYQCFYLVRTTLSGFSRFFKPIFLSGKRQTRSNHSQFQALHVFAVLFLSRKYLCFDSYLKYAQRKAVITGKFDALLEYIAGQHPTIEGTELHAYSFGSIIAYDILFPFGAPPGERVRSKINLLITIGNPHDFIKNYYPSYFNRRKRYMLALTSWYNVYSQSDILSSNFRYDPKPGPAIFSIIQGQLLPQNINYELIQPDTFSLWDIFRLYLLKIHSGYWDTDEDGSSCLTNVIQTITNTPKPALSF